MLDNKGQLLMFMMSECLNYLFNRIIIKKQLIKNKKIVSYQDSKSMKNEITG